MPDPEQLARQQIDPLLEKCGWQVQDKSSVNLHSQRGVAVRELSFKTGEPDYTLFVEQKAIGTVEAKPVGHSLTGVEEQSEKYVKGVPFGIPAWRSPLPFSYESTGTETRFTNRLDPEPRSRNVFAFHRPETLLKWAQAEKQLNQNLREFPALVTDKLWKAQIEAITNLEASFAANKPRALIQMATGSGKTFTAVNFTYRLIKNAGARRVLFLVDRGNLGEQTFKEFDQFESPVNNFKFTQEFIVQHLKRNVLDDSARVVISTVQRLYSMLKGETEPAAAIVRPMEKTADGLIVLSEPNTRLKRHVCITFDSDEAANEASFYSYRDVTIEKQNEDGSYALSSQSWSDEPLSKAQYDIWIEQAVNQTVGARLESISKEMRIADALDAPYLTESTFEAGLLARSGQPAPPSGSTALKFLQANADMLNLEDPKAIFQLRTDKAKLLNRFRLSLAAISEELKGLDGQDFEQRARQLFEKEIQPQIAEVNAAIGRLESAAAKGLIQTGAALALGLLSGPMLPVAALLVFAAAGVAGEALPAVGDYQRARKQPQFIWHKLRK